MKLNDKLGMIGQQLRSISTHDDAPYAEVVATLSEAEAYAKAARKDVLKRRKPALSTKLKAAVSALFG